MINNLSLWFFRILAFLIIFSVLYVLAVFFWPDWADQYGDPDLNRSIRELKEHSLDISDFPDSSQP